MSRENHGGMDLAPMLEQSSDYSRALTKNIRDFGFTFAEAEPGKRAMAKHALAYTTRTLDFPHPSFDLDTGNVIFAGPTVKIIYLTTGLEVVH